MTTAKTGRSTGKVTCQNRFQGLAPSMSAASCSSLGTVSRPASTVTATNGKPLCTMLSVTIA